MNIKKYGLNCIAGKHDELFGYRSDIFNKKEETKSSVGLKLGVIATIAFAKQMDDDTYNKVNGQDMLKWSRCDNLSPEEKIVMLNDVADIVSKTINDIKMYDNVNLLTLVHLQREMQLRKKNE